MTHQAAQLVDGLIQAFHQRKPIRTGSLIVTLFGDSVLPHGGNVWLGSLIKACGLMNISHRLVRTAVYRLVQDGLLTNEAVGRRAFYSLTATGCEAFNSATQRIYFAERAAWDGTWCMVMAQQLHKVEREQLRRDLVWMGFGHLGQDVFVRPHTGAHNQSKEISDALARAGIGDRVLVMNGRQDSEFGDVLAAGFFAKAWPLDELARAYQDFIRRFQPCAEALRKGCVITDADAFVLRTCLLHEYRKIILRDPGLPAELLPLRFPGHLAFQLVSELYQVVLAPAERYIEANFVNRAGDWPRLQPSFAARFGGLQLPPAC
jgi:phenylacetic acid degradation operon negative regulatory protein